MDTTAIASTNSTSSTKSTQTTTAGLSGDDFFELLITQLTNQDPLEPTTNQELLNQISSIRDIELSTSLTESLEALTGQQRFASASSLIGQFVTGTDGESGEAVQGIVSAVEFDDNGKAVLELNDGSQIPLESVDMVLGADRAANALVGQMIVGLDRTSSDEAELAEGLVTGVGRGESGEVTLELDTGQSIALIDLLQWGDESVADGSAA